MSKSGGGSVVVELDKEEGDPDEFMDAFAFSKEEERMLLNVCVVSCA